MSNNLLPKDQEEIAEWERLQGVKSVLDELDVMFDSDEFEEFYKSPASLLLSPWFDKKRAKTEKRLNELMVLIKQRYDL
jgi:hypothetical protein